MAVTRRIDVRGDFEQAAGSLVDVALAELDFVDPDVDRAWQDLVARRRAGMSRIIDLFADRGELREGLDRSLALDLLFGTNRAETYLAFTVECGWSMARYKAWQFATLALQLLPATTAEAILAGRSEDVADMSFKDELALFV